MPMDLEQPPSDDGTGSDQISNGSGSQADDVEDASSREDAPELQACSEGGKSRKQVQCQVPGCTADLLAEGKPYCIKKRLCPEHMRADSIQRKGHGDQEWRFCFQCGKCEPLSEFDGSKRSCRVRLQKRRQPPKRSATWGAGCFPKVQRSAGWLPGMQLEEWQDSSMSDLSWPVRDQLQLQAHMRQQQMMLQYQQQLQQEQQKLEWELMQHQMAAAGKPAPMPPLPAAAPANSGKARRGRAPPSKSATMACLHSRMPSYGISGLVDTTPAYSVGTGAAAAAAAALAPAGSAVAGPASSVPAQLLAVAQQPVLQPLLSCGQAAAASATGVAIAAAPAASSVSWPGSAPLPGQPGESAVEAVQTVQLPIGAAAGSTPEDDLDAALDQMLRELDDGAESMELDAGGLESVFDYCLTAAGRLAGGTPSSQPEPVHCMNGTGSCSYGSAATLEPAILLAPQHQQQQQPPLMRNSMVQQHVANGYMEAQFPLHSSGAVSNGMVQQQQQLQQLHQTIMADQHELLSLMRQQKQQLFALRDQQLANEMSGLMRNSAGAPAAAAATAGSCGPPSAAVDSRLAVLRHHFSAVQALLAQTRSLVESMHELDPATAVEMVCHLKDTLRGGGAGLMVPGAGAAARMGTGVMAQVGAVQDLQQQVSAMGTTASNVTMQMPFQLQHAQQQGVQGGFI